MMGPRQVAQGTLFYEFSIDDYVPNNHLLRSIDRFVDLADVRPLLAPYYSEGGRPSIDPELMIRMLLLGYCQGIRSERRLCEEVHLNLAYRWFCKLDLTDPVPDHSTFPKNRYGRFRDSGIFRHLFEKVLQRCIDEGLVGSEGFGVDASLIPANANQTRGVDGTEGLAAGYYFIRSWCAVCPVWLKGSRDDGHIWRRFPPEFGELSEVLGGGEQEFVPCAIRHPEG